MTLTILLVSVVLSFVVVTIFPVHEASAKQCNNDNNNNNADTHSTTCTNKQDSSNSDHSTTIITKDNTPFVLSLPFP
jgi:hypothetical protein